MNIFNCLHAGTDKENEADCNDEVEINVEENSIAYEVQGENNGKVAKDHATKGILLDNVGQETTTQTDSETDENHIDDLDLVTDKETESSYDSGIHLHVATYIAT